MAASATPKSAEGLPGAPRRVAVAASGGRDSTALLHCVARQAQALGIGVVALHVHHGLMPQADAWLTQVKGQAKRWGADFLAQRLASRPAAGESIEAWARRERYRALADMALAQQCSVVLLAHHRRDQAETWLLQALRGAGAAGLSAMPSEARRNGLLWCRPWLKQPRESIEAYVRRHRLRCVEDSSNTDPRFARNRLRLQVWPALTQAFGDAETSLAAAAVQAQEARTLALEVAAVDLAAPCVWADGALHVPAWLQLSPARRVNALRVWLHQGLGQGVPASLVQRLMVELLRPMQGGAARTTGRWPALGQELQLHRQVLRVVPATPPRAPTAATLPVNTLPAQDAINLARAGRWPAQPWAGAFEVRRVRTGGVPAQLLQSVHLRQRVGGERFAARPGAVPRSLKKQYQAAGISPWQRQGPLLWTGDGRLLFVPGLGIHAACLAGPGESQFSLRWLPQTA